MGAYRAKFVMESVSDLRASLQGLGSDLMVAVGKPEEVIAGGCSRAACRACQCALVPGLLLGVWHCGVDWCMSTAAHEHMLCELLCVRLDVLMHAESCLQDSGHPAMVGCRLCGCVAV